MVKMKGKKVLYAAVGAPVVAVRKLGKRVEEIRASLNKEADTLGKTANERMEVWATEGEKVVTRLSEGKMVDEIAAKVDFEQVSEQVSKLRDQLEDMLSTWRASFRPERAAVKAPEVIEVETAAAKPAAKKATTAKASGTAKKAPAKKAPAKKSAANTGAKSTTRKAPAAKAS
jgi:hypothetical protein